MIRYNVAAIQKLMKRHRVANANRLSEYAGLTIPTAYNVLRGAPLQRIEVATLESLATAFGVTPWALLDWEDR